MINIKKHCTALAIVAAGMGISHRASAACASEKCEGRIDLLYVTQAGNKVYVDPEGSVSPLTCTDVSGTYVELTLDNEYRKAIWQLLLAAYLAGRDVTIKLPASGACTIQYATTPPN